LYFSFAATCTRFAAKHVHFTAALPPAAAMQHLPRQAESTPAPRFCTALRQQTASALRLQRWHLPRQSRQSRSDAFAPAVASARIRNESMVVRGWLQLKAPCRRDCPEAPGDPLRLVYQTKNTSVGFCLTCCASGITFGISESGVILSSTLAGDCKTARPLGKPGASDEANLLSPDYVVLAIDAPYCHFTSSFLHDLN
jgi:hypothetical protein